MHELLSKRWEKRAKGDKGFTLIELLVVVVILGVLIAIAIPLYLNYRKGANDAASQSDLRNAVNVLELCNADNGSYPAGPIVLSNNNLTATVTACTRPINLSAGTNLVYTAQTGTAGGYVISDNNSNGTSGKFYCYNSALGGSVTSQAKAPASPATTGCN